MEFGKVLQVYWRCSLLLMEAWRCCSASHDVMEHPHDGAFEWSSTGSLSGETATLSHVCTLIDASRIQELTRGGAVAITPYMNSMPEPKRWGGTRGSCFSFMFNCDRALTYLSGAQSTMTPTLVFSDWRCSLVGIQAQSGSFGQLVELRL